MAAAGNCSQPTYIVGDSCYQCDPTINCYPVGGSCVDNVCACNYGFADDNCSVPIVSVTSGGFLTLRYFFGLGLLILIACLSLALHIYLWARVLPARLAKIVVARNLPLLTTALCFIASFLRIFYYAPDPYSFAGTRVLCGLWGIDYFSTWLTYTAFALLTIQWTLVVSKLLISKKMSWIVPLLRVFRIYLVVSFFVLCACATASTVMSCVCDGSICPYQAADYLYFISWQVFSGIAIIFSVTVASIIIHNMGSRQAKHARRLVRFSVFVIMVSVALLLLLGYTISLFVDYAATPEGFLASESLEVIFIVLTLGAILIVLSSERKRVSAHSSQTSGISSARSAARDSGVSRDDVFAPSRDVGILDLESDEEEEPEHEHEEQKHKQPSVEKKRLSPPVSKEQQPDTDVKEGFITL